jgi:hypothetical protein
LSVTHDRLLAAMVSFGLPSVAQLEMLLPAGAVTFVVRTIAGNGPGGTG